MWKIVEAPKLVNKKLKTLVLQYIQNAPIKLKKKKKNPIIHDKTQSYRIIYTTPYTHDYHPPSCNNPNTSLQDQFVTHNEKLNNSTTMSPDLSTMKTKKIFSKKLIRTMIEYLLLVSQSLSNRSLSWSLSQTQFIKNPSPS